ncbi:MAG: helix-turn-helix domain-containing protein [Nitrososphaerota archaeon]|jgi:predicted DNA binding protein|nr:helix-turn-helix domain-containing protein [Nitrososphaerota archaeon]
MKPESPVEAYIQIKETGCEVAKFASAMTEKMFIERVKLGPHTSIHLVTFERLSTDTYSKTVSSFQGVAKVGDRKLLIESKSCAFCRELSNSKAVLMGTEQLDNGVTSYRVIAMSKKSLSDLGEKLKRQEAKITIVDPAKSLNGLGLTIRQRQIIALASKNGYFDLDRKVTLTKLARSLGISPASFDETLRRALKKLVEDYIENKEGTNHAREYAT